MLTKEMIDNRRIFLHPNCMWCDNCQSIRLKNGYGLIQYEDGETNKFCAECLEDTDEQINIEEDQEVYK